MNHCEIIQLFKILERSVYFQVTTRQNSNIGSRGMNSVPFGTDDSRIERSGSEKNSAFSGERRYTLFASNLEEGITCLSKATNNKQVSERYGSIHVADTFTFSLTFWSRPYYVLRSSIKQLFVFHGRRPESLFSKMRRDKDVYC